MLIMMDDDRRKRGAKKWPRKKLEGLMQRPDAFWVIECLLDKRVRPDGGEEYLVHWEGFNHDSDTWESREELEKNATAMVHEFERIYDPVLSSDKAHCICKRPYRFEQGGMIQCYNCIEWFHFKCLRMSIAEANSYRRFYCLACRIHRPFLKNQFFEELLEVRKPSFFSSDSSRSTLWSPT